MLKTFETFNQMLIVFLLLMDRLDSLKSQHFDKSSNNLLIFNENNNDYYFSGQALKKSPPAILMNLRHE